VTTIQKVRGNVTEEILHLRSIDYILKKEDFHKVFEAATDEEKLVALEYIRKREKNSLISWMKNQSRKSDCSLLSLVELRILAGQLSIARIPYKSKDELIDEINKKRLI
jgi:hypothetical protein